MGIICDIIELCGVIIVGYWLIVGYYFEVLKGLVDDDYFVGLVIDEDC